MFNSLRLPTGLSVWLVYFLNLKRLLFDLKPLILELFVYTKVEQLLLIQVNQLALQEWYLLFLLSQCAHYCSLELFKLWVSRLIKRFTLIFSRRLSCWGFSISLLLNLWLILFVLNLYFKICFLVNGLFIVYLLTCVLVVNSIFRLGIFLALWSISFIQKLEILMDWLDLILAKLCPDKILCLIVWTDLVLWFTIWLFFTESNWFTWIKIIAYRWMTAWRRWFFWMIFMLTDMLGDIIWKNSVMGLDLCFAFVSVWHSYEFQLILRCFAILEPNYFNLILKDELVKS